MPKKSQVKKPLELDGVPIEIHCDKNNILPSDAIIANNLTLKMGGKTLLDKSDLKITFNNKYGLLGANGSGKSTLLKCIQDRLIPSDKNIKIIEVEQTFISSEKSIYQTLLETNKELFKLKKIYDELENKELEENEVELYYQTCERLDELNFDSNDSLIRKILNGLGFSEEQIMKSTDSFSGGWQRRIALAKVLYLDSDIILLDEPTNHLDLEAVLWLSNFLPTINKTLIIVSHSLEFLNRVCNNTIFIHQNKIKQFRGNYDDGKKQLKLEKDKIKKDYESLERKLKEMSRKNKTKKEKEEYKKSLNLPPRVSEYKVKYPNYQSLEIKGNLVEIENMKFSYNEKKLLENINLKIPMGKRYTIVGKNGSGKSTLLKLISQELKPNNGEININPIVRLGYYHQHFDTLLPEDETPVSYLLNYMSDEMNIAGEFTRSIRKMLGQIKLEGKAHLQEIKTLSGGQKARVAWLAMILKKPHLIILDEPTNHMDLEGIEGMIKSLKNYNGTIISVTHDPTLITKLNSELLVVENNTLNVWKGDYEDYFEYILEI